MEELKTFYCHWLQDKPSDHKREFGKKYILCSAKARRQIEARNTTPEVVSAQGGEEEQQQVSTDASALEEGSTKPRTLEKFSTD